jgi:hypothetical protein
MLFVSCQFFHVKPTDKVQSTSPNSNFVFDQNIYQQKISIHIMNADEKTMTFDGAIKRSNLNLSLYAYTAVGFRIFTLNDRDGQIKFESHVSQIEDKKEFILKLYPVIKKIFMLKLSDKDFINRKFSYQLEEPIGNVEVQLKNRDLTLGAETRVNLITVTKEKYFEFKIINLEN